MRSSVSGRVLAALGRSGRTPPMLVASVVAWRCDAEAAQTRQQAPQAREIVAAGI